jgi:hypothetical protein
MRTNANATKAHRRPMVSVVSNVQPNGFPVRRLERDSRLPRYYGASARRARVATLLRGCTTAARAALAAVLIFASVCGRSYADDLRVQIVGRDGALGEHVNSGTAFISASGAFSLAPNGSHESSMMISFGALERINYTSSDSDGGESLDIAVKSERVEIFYVEICKGDVALTGEYGLSAPTSLCRWVPQTLSGGFIDAGSPGGDTCANIDALRWRVTDVEVMNRNIDDKLIVDDGQTRNFNSSWLNPWSSSSDKSRSGDIRGIGCGVGRCLRGIGGDFDRLVDFRHLVQLLRAGGRRGCRSVSHREYWR